MKYISLYLGEIKGFNAQVRTPWGKLTDDMSATYTSQVKFKSLLNEHLNGDPIT